MFVRISHIAELVVARVVTRWTFRTLRRIEALKVSHDGH